MGRRQRQERNHRFCNRPSCRFLAFQPGVAVRPASTVRVPETPAVCVAQRPESATPISSPLPVLSTLMLAENLVDVLDGVRIKLHDLGLRAHRGRWNGPGLLATVRVRSNPGFVLAVLAPPVRMRQEMGAGLKKYFHDPGTGKPLGIMGNLN